MAVSQKLSLTQESQDSLGNFSRVRILWESTQTEGSFNANTRTAYYYVSVNGGTEKQYSVSYTLPKLSTAVIVDTVLEIPHNEDGEATVTVRTWMDTRISAGVVQKSQTLALTDIPRASALSLSAYEIALNGADGAVAAVITPAGEAYSHILTARFGTWTAVQELAAGVTEADILLPVTLLGQIPGRSAGAGTVTLQTVSDGVTLGAQSVSFTVKTDTPYNVPTVSGYSVERCDADGTPNDDGGYMRVTGDISFSDLGGANSIHAQVTYWEEGSATVYTAGDFISGEVNIYELVSDAEYVVKLSVQDLFGEVYAMEMLDTGDVLIEYHAYEELLEFKKRVSVPSLSLGDGMVMLSFPDGAWVGSLISESQEEFSPADGCSGLFFSNDGKVYAVQGAAMSEIVSGETVVSAENVRYKDGVLTDYMYEVTTEEEYEELGEAGRKPGVPYFIV